jgi:hypothetical protein
MILLSSVSIFQSHRPGQCPEQRPSVRPSGEEWGVAA